MDGIGMWRALSKNLESPRQVMLHNIDDGRKIAAVRVGNFKLVNGRPESKNYFNTLH